MYGSFMTLFYALLFIPRLPRDDKKLPVDESIEDFPNGSQIEADGKPDTVNNAYAMLLIGAAVAVIAIVVVST
jgi:hypothetical protein